jgi:hypothetical protein
MQNPKHRAELPRLLIFMVAITAGVLAALAVQIGLSDAGFEPAATWQQVFSTKAQLRTAGPWWAIAGAAFIAAGLCGSALSWLAPPWRFRALRWLAAALAILALAHVGHSAGAAPAAATAGAQVAANLAALGIAFLMALLGAYFTVRR